MLKTVSERIPPTVPHDAASPDERAPCLIASEEPLPKASPEPVRAARFGYVQSAPLVREPGASFWSAATAIALLAGTAFLRILSREPGARVLDAQLGFVLVPPVAAGLCWLLYARDFGTRRFMRAFNVVASIGLLVAFALFGRSMAGAFGDAQEDGLQDAISRRFGSALSEAFGTMDRKAAPIPFARDDFTLEYTAGWHTLTTPCLHGDAAAYEALCMRGPQPHQSLIVAAMDLRSAREARARARTVAERDRGAFVLPQYEKTANVTRVGSLEHETYRFEISARDAQDLVFVETVIALGPRLYVVLGITPRDGLAELRKISDSFASR